MQDVFSGDYVCNLRSSPALKPFRPPVCSQWRFPRAVATRSDSIHRERKRVSDVCDGRNEPGRNSVKQRRNVAEDELGNTGRGKTPSGEMIPTPWWLDRREGSQ